MLFHIEHPIPIPMEDDLVHTDHDPFCCDPSCPCHENSQAIEQVSDLVENGLMTSAEATRFVQGSQL